MLSLRFRFTLLQCALLLLLGAHCVTAGYTPCSDPATCGSTSCCTLYNGVNYCCPGSGNSFDTKTLQCANSPQCALPTYGVIAVWPFPGCPGEATYQSYTMPGGGAFSECLDVTSSLAGDHSVLSIILIGASRWQVKQYTSVSDCSARTSADFYYTTATTGQYDASCYNFKDGSFSLYRPGQPSAPAAGSTVSYPPMHALQYTSPPATTSATQVSVAFWTGSAGCLSGSSLTYTLSSGGCNGIRPSPGASFLYSYRLTCAAKTTTSTWTLTPYTLTGCQSQYANPPITGTGPVCVEIGLWAGSAFIDCASQSAGDYFNYLPPTDGGWNSTYGDCVGACGGTAGTQTRTCSAPTPSGGGATCVGSATQACTTSVCPTVLSSSAGASSGSDGSTGSTGSPSGQSAYDPTVWLGTYSIASGCDQTQCCCARTSTVTASGSTYTVTGTDLAGQCGTSVPASVQATAPTPTSNTATYTVNGQTHTTQRQSDGSIIDTNTAAASCSATLTKSSAVINGAGAQSAPFQPVHLFAVLLASAVAALVAF